MAHMAHMAHSGPDRLAIKVSLRDGDTHIEDEVKRFDLDRAERPSNGLIDILTKIENIFPVLLEHEYCLTWTDQVATVHVGVYGYNFL